MATESHRNSVRNYNARNYKQLMIRVRKGEDTRLKAYADSQGMSLNNFVCSCLSYCIAQGIDVSATPALTETLPEYVDE